MLRLAVGASLAFTTLAADPCACLNWKQTYASERVLCAEAQEFYNDSLPLAFAVYGDIVMGHAFDDVCNVYRGLDTDACVNYRHFIYGTEHSGKQWCYVSDKCKDLNGGKKVQDKESIMKIPSWAMKFLGKFFGKLGFPHQYASEFLENFHTPQKLTRDVAWKMCTPGKDNMMKDMNPLDLIKLGESIGDGETTPKIDISLLLKLAYAQVRDEHHDAEPLWDAVRVPIGNGNLDELPAIVKKAIDAKYPIILDTDAHGEHSGDRSRRIIVGKEVYKVNREKGKPMTYSKGHDIGEL